MDILSGERYVLLRRIEVELDGSDSNASRGYTLPMALAEVLSKVRSRFFGKRRLDFTVNSRFENHSARRLNRIIGTDETTYLEIGVSEGFTLEKVRASKIFAVDPNPKFDYKSLPNNVKFFKSSSDEFFDNLNKDQKFNLIFLDGLHHADFLFRDFLNALRHLAIKGWILIDDIIPCDSVSALIPEELSLKIRNQLNLSGQPWHGDVFQILTLIQRFQELFEWYIIIYPNNPQMLIRPKLFFDIDKFVTDGKKFWDKRQKISYQQFFSEEMVSSLPMHFEELLLEKIMHQD